MSDGFDEVYVDTRRQLRGVAESLIAGRNTGRRAPSGWPCDPVASQALRSRSPSTAPSWSGPTARLRWQDR